MLCVNRDSDCSRTDQKSVGVLECATGEVPEDGETAVFLDSSCSRKTTQSESVRAMQLSSIDVSPITKIFGWLD